MNLSHVVGISDVEVSLHSEYKELAEDSDHFLPNAFSKLFSALRLLSSSYDKNLNFLSNITQILVDDSGLCVPALGFEPGVHSAYYAGIPRDDTKNNLKLMDQIRISGCSANNQNCEPDERRLDAFFVCFLLKINLDRGLSFFNKIEPKSAKFFENEDLIKCEKEFLNDIDFSKSAGNFFKKVPVNLFCSKILDDFFVDIYCGFCIGEVSTNLQELSSSGHGYDPLFYPKAHPRLSFSSVSMAGKNRVSHRALAMEKLIENQ